MLETYKIMFNDGQVITVMATSLYNAKQLAIDRFIDEYDEDDINFIEVNGTTINIKTNEKLSTKLQCYEKISTINIGYEDDFTSED